MFSARHLLAVEGWPAQQPEQSPPCCPDQVVRVGGGLFLHVLSLRVQD